MSRFILTLTAGAMIAGIASQGFATQAQDKSPQEGSFQYFDTDGDGNITADEMNAAYNTSFDKVDLNQDNEVSGDELMYANIQRALTRTDELMEKYDADNDGFITRDEMAAQKPGQVFFKMDTNSDGKLTPEEFGSGPEK